MKTNPFSWRGRLFAAASALAIRGPTTRRTPPTHTQSGAASAVVLIAPTALVVAAIVMVTAAQFTDIDLWLADLYYDPVGQVFPWEKNWFASDFMHGYLKNFIVCFGLLTIASTLIDLVYPIFRKSQLRRLQWRFVALAAMLEPLLVGSLKASSNLHCPLAIDRYGGREPLLRLLDAVPPGWQAGHCFPAGHASAGMWLSALAIFWLPAHPTKALAVFCGGLSVGLTMGWVQQMRGMHFLSHTLATVWLSTALLFAMLSIFWKWLNADATPTRPQ